MSDVVQETASAPVPAPGQLPHPEKKDQAEKLILQILSQMGFPARLELKDAEDGAISVAVFFEADPPQAPAGRRANVVDALQFIVNKVVNRPQYEKRWVNIGVGAHPEPRKPRDQRAPPQAAEGGDGGAGAPPSTPGVRLPPGPAARAASSRPAMQRQRQAAPPPPRSAPRPADPDEAAMQVSDDAELSAAARKLAERSAQLGRFYAVMAMKPEDRARLVQAAKGAEGVTLRVEGEARARRATFVPAKPTPMPKKQSLQMFDDGDDDLED